MGIFNKNTDNSNLCYKSDLKLDCDTIYDVTDAELISSQALMGLTFKLGNRISTRDEFISTFKVGNEIIHSLSRRVFCEVAGLEGNKFTVRVKVINLGKSTETSTIIGVTK